MKLTINVITRGRPKLLIQTVDSILANIELPETRLLICADDDDDLTIAALKLAKLGPNVIVSVAPREDSRGEKYDRALRLAPADVYLPAVDCALFKTKGFDRIILEAASIFPDGIGCVYTPMANLSWPKFQAPTAGLVKKLGYIYCHDYPFWFIDHELDDIVKMIDRYSYADIDIDVASMRPEKTIGLRDLQFWAAYFDARMNVRRDLARSIVESEDFQEPDFRKQLNLRNHALYEQRSMMITQLNRMQAAEIEATRGGIDSANDERYQRIKSKAEHVLLANFAAMDAAEQVDPIIIRHADVHGIEKDWSWPANDYWGWEHPLNTWPQIKSLLSLCKNRRVVVQAGGCCGMYPALLAREFEHVYTAELEPLNFRCLVKNCQEPNITKIHAAFGDRQGTVDIDYRSINNCGQHHVKDGPGAVEMMRIDDLYLKVCDAILLDAEAYETKIINGALETIRRCQPELIVAETISDEMVQVLAREGYVLADQAAYDRHFVKQQKAVQAA